MSRQSWSQQEANPLGAGGGAQFGATSIAIKSGVVATFLVIQHIALRHRPDLYEFGGLTFEGSRVALD
jgi:hypothetical protein